MNLHYLCLFLTCPPNAYRLSRSKALVWQIGVVSSNSRSTPNAYAPPASSNAGGKAKGGTLLVAGLNVFMNEFTAGVKSAHVPEAAWLLHSLLQYGYSAPKPAGHMVLKKTECPNCFPSVNINLCVPEPL